MNVIVRDTEEGMVIKISGRQPPWRKKSAEGDRGRYGGAGADDLYP